MDYIEFALLIIAGYLVGSVPAAYIAAKAYKGIDLRKFGSGNVGLSNFYRATGSKWLAVLVILWDGGKGALVVWAADALGFSLTHVVIVGLAAVAGHNWSVFLRFSAGRGILALAGVSMYLMWWPTLIIAAVSVCFRLAALPVLCLVAALPLASWLTGEPLPVTIGLAALFVMMVIRRLTAPRTADVPVDRDLLISRLLYDRDVKDAKGWVDRKIDPQALKKSKKPGDNR